jgi:peptide chain release factor 3
MRWITAADPAVLKRFIDSNRSAIATDSDGAYVYMAPSVFSLNWVVERNPDIRFVDIKTVEST